MRTFKQWCRCLFASKLFDCSNVFGIPTRKVLSIVVAVLLVLYLAPAVLTSIALLTVAAERRKR